MFDKLEKNKSINNKVLKILIISKMAKLFKIIYYQLKSLAYSH